MSAADPHQDENGIPLVLDVDGTLLRTDLLYETFWAALGHDFPATMRVALATWRHPERLKRALTDIARPQIELLPVRDEIVDIARAAIRAGRPVHLVSGSDQQLIDALADHLGLPEPHFGSDPGRNLTDATKAAFLADRFGRGGYDYAGNARADLKAWEGARKVIAVDPPGPVERRLTQMGKPVRIVADGWGLRDVVRELRPHQWVKNLLLFLPLLITHSFSVPGFLAVAMATLAFSLGASSIYILNDLLDLEADRIHPEKRLRPIASGALPIPTAMRVSAALVATAILLALSVSPQVAGLTILYMAGSLSYSLWFKKRRWLDVLALACLFLLRVLTGAVAADVMMPPLLLAFGFTVFFALACVKRLTALSRMPQQDHLPGRGYAHRDLVPVERAAFASIPVAAGLYLAYVWGPHAASLYSAPILASAAVVPVVLWLVRMVRLSVQGREDYDPVRFVLHDRPGLAMAGVGVLLLILAA